MPLPENSSPSAVVSKFSEGTFNIDDYVHSQPQSPAFVRMIVMEVVSDPNLGGKRQEEKKQKWHEMRITNMELADVLPRNTIIAKRAGDASDPMFVFPFFPSHLSLPCKPGEAVWVMIENPDARSLEIAYWFCRIVEPHTSDDVNHSHPGRSAEPSLNPGVKERHDNENQGTAESGENVWHELRNGVAVLRGDERITSTEGVILKNETEDVFENLITKTEAARLMTYESIPRFRKRPGDVTLEGSNNALIVLGTDRSGSIEISDNKKTVNSGLIDIVVGRGQTEATFGKATSTTSIKDAKGKKKGKELKKEINKTPDVLKTTEGDPDLKNDRSRIYVAQRTEVDKNFGLEEYNKKDDYKFELNTKKEGDSGIIEKSDKIRIIGRKDVQITVLGFEEKDGKVVDAENDDNRCTITINGKTGKIFIDAKQSISVRSEKGDIEVIAKNGKQVLTSKKEFDVNTEDKFNVTAKRDVSVKSDGLINLGNNSLEWAPKFETFHADLMKALTQIHAGLMAGTQGSPVAQQLVTYQANSSDVLSLIGKMQSGTYKSKKVKNE